MSEILANPLASLVIGVFLSIIVNVLVSHWDQILPRVSYHIILSAAKSIPSQMRQEYTLSRLADLDFIDSNWSKFWYAITSWLALPSTLSIYYQSSALHSIAIEIFCKYCVYIGLYSKNEGEEKYNYTLNNREYWNLIFFPIFLSSLLPFLFLPDFSKYILSPLSSTIVLMFYGFVIFSMAFFVQFSKRFAKQAMFLVFQRQISRRSLLRSLIMKGNYLERTKMCFESWKVNSVVSQVCWTAESCALIIQE